MTVAVVDAKGKPVWKDLTALEKEVEDDEVKVLFQKFGQWKEGYSLDFLFGSPLQDIGNESGSQPTKTKAKSSKAKSRSGRKTKKKSSK